MEKGYDLTTALREVEVRSLILQGEQDPIDAVTAREIQALLRNSELQFIPECGHFPWLEKPEAFGEAVARFLGGAKE